MYNIKCDWTPSFEDLTIQEINTLYEFRALWKSQPQQVMLVDTEFIVLRGHLVEPPATKRPRYQQLAQPLGYPSVMKGKTPETHGADSGEGI